MAWLAVFVVICFAAPAASVTVAGHTAGQFQVSESGAATYTIPVTAAPGTGGMEPQLAFSYNSQGYNSLLGVGWSLSGLSAISRCPATLAQDGFIDPVDFDDSDRFCLDGERLMAVGGVYGANATEYRTEQDTFRRVISEAQAGSGPASFTVRTKEGLLFEYGGTPDSRIEAQGRPSVLFWAVNRIIDTKGNYLTITYGDDNGSYYPQRIDYTANDAANLSSYASVRFLYEVRPDITARYVAGSLVGLTQRLTAIRSYEGEQIYREYRLSYEASEASGRSRLTRITECGSNGDCFPPTTFIWQAWQVGDFNFNGAGTALWAGHGGGIQNNFLGDFNGDGKTDIMGYAFNPQQWHVVLSNGVSFGGGGGFWRGHDGGPTNNFLGDFNGDGKTDTMGYTFNPGVWHVALSDGTSFNGPGSGLWHGHSGGPTNNSLGDFNGDGRTDIMGYTGVPGLWHVNLSSGSDFNAPGSGMWNGHRGTLSDNFIGDFNGDGRSDTMGYTGIPGQWHVALSDGTSFTAPGSGIWHGHRGVANNNFLGDFNGDGMTDIMGYTGSQGLWHVSLSSGAEFNAPGSGNWHGHDGARANNFLGDFNGDGMTDIARYKSGGVWSVCLSLGTDFSCRDWAGHSGGVDNNFLGDFNGDGQTDMMGYTGTFGLWHVALAGGPLPDLLGTISDGLGASTTIAYSSLAETAAYSRGSTASYPEQDFAGPLYVVTSFSASNGIGGISTFGQGYAGAIVNLEGRGFRGFERSSVLDVLTGIKTTIDYEHDFKRISSKVRRIEQRLANGVLVSEVDNENEVHDHGFGVNFSFVRVSVAKRYELDGSLVSTVATTTEVDENGNVSDLGVDYGDGFTEHTSSTYADDLENWFLGRLTRSTVTRTAGGASQTRATAFTYDPDSGILTAEIIEPGHPTLQLVKTYQHDAFGNVVVSTVSAPNVATRTSVTATDALGRYVTASSNPLGHMEFKSYALGNMKSHTGPNALSTSWEHDGFGRQTLERQADGTETTTSYALCGSDCPEWAVYLARRTTIGAPTNVTYYDLLDRVVREETEGFDGTAIYVDSKYNARGLRHFVSEPYFTGATPPIWTEYNFDALGRVYRVTAPGGRVTSTQYAGRTTAVTNPLGQRSVQLVDARGQLIASSDELGGIVTYTYDAFGNLVEMIDPLGNTTRLTYDIRGNRTSIVDPDTGRSTFVYDALGQLTGKTGATGDTVTYGYDVLGRMVSRSEREGTSLWDYDAGPRGIGKLFALRRGDYLEEYFYDALGRVERTRTTIAGTSYTLTTSYNAGGRPETLTYPTGFGIKTVYNGHGYPQAIQRLSDGQLLWQAETVNARGQLERASLGNGLMTTRETDPETGRVERIRTGNVQDLAFSYDALGNLLSRSDDRRGLNETFVYDRLNRLIGSRVAGQAPVAVTYDALGNITSRSDVGAYAYGAEGAGPHAVTSIVGSRGGIFAYDGNGNMVARQRRGTYRESSNGSETSTTYEGPLAAIHYASFNKPTTISEGETTLTFSYGPEYDRYRQVVTNSSGVTTKVYVGGVFERETSATKTRSIHYLRALGEVFAVYATETDGAATVQSMRYLHRDHLGSVQTVTNETGAVVEVLAFDAWGLRRNALDWSPAVAPIAPGIDRGFTGHEHLDEVSLIHMNGRVYDPVIGRFLSADPFVEAPDALQGLNRYSYAINNPLSLTDPSGFFLRGLRRFIGRLFSSANLGSAVAVVAGFLTQGLAVGIWQAFGGAVSGFGAMVASGAGFGFGSSFTGALLSGGGLGDALRSGLQGFVTGGVGSASSAIFGSASFGFKVGAATEVVAHGITQGLLGVARGGKLEHGFLSGIVDALIPGRTFSDNQLLQTAVATLAGGTAAELGGGKFANGAVSAAFGSLLSGPSGTSGPKRSLDLVGKLWALPASLGGLALGGLSYLYGLVTGTNPSVGFGHNALEFSNAPLPFGSAVTFGNVIIYRPNFDEWGYSDFPAPTPLHEEGHTWQYQLFGAFFLPLYFASGGVVHNARDNRFEWSASVYGTTLEPLSWFPW